MKRVGEGLNQVSITNLDQPRTYCTVKVKGSECWRVPEEPVTVMV